MLDKIKLNSLKYEHISYIYNKIENIVVLETLITSLNLKLVANKSDIKVLNTQGDGFDHRRECFCVTPNVVNGKIIYNLFFNHYLISESMYEQFRHQQSFHYDEEGLIDMIHKYFSLEMFP